MDILEKLEKHYCNQLGVINIQGKTLKKGITTGTVAAATAYSSAIAILTGKKLETVEIKLPRGEKISVLVDKVNLMDNLTAISYGYKYAGDDIDVTNLAYISSKVRINDTNKVTITADKGIGIFTRDILESKKGEYAINPGPKKSIEDNLIDLKKSILHDKEELSIIAKNIDKDEKFIENLGFEVVLSVKNGQEIAKKTFNPRLGIIGGISILGTTGIVMPMSEEALKESIKKEIASKPFKTIALTFGNIGEKALIAKKIPSERICICSNFIGYSINQAVEMGVENLLISGHIGKMVKISAGIFNTHSHVADARVEILISNLALMKAPYELLQKISNTLTAQEAADIIIHHGYEKVFDIISEKAAERSRNYSYNKINVETMIFDIKGNLLGKSSNANNLNWNN